MVVIQAVARANEDARSVGRFVFTTCGHEEIFARIFVAPFHALKFDERPLTIPVEEVAIWQTGLDEEHRLQEGIITVHVCVMPAEDVPHPAVLQLKP